MARTVAPTEQPAERRNTEIYWYAGLLIDVIHMPLVIGMVLLGATWWQGPVYVGVVTAVVVVQIAFLGCPFFALTRWLKRKHDPTFEGNWSVTVMLYRRYGRLVGVAVFAFFLVVALVLRWLLFPAG